MSKFFDQYMYNTFPSPHYKGENDLAIGPVKHASVKYIAYYLPQFHQIEENNNWWGKGFTEWTNTSKALPKFRGHYQPRLPADLGYYDLSNSDVLALQSELATRAGIYGFCIHNYWFNGKTLLEKPLLNLIKNKNVKLKFCLNWANENWTRRWDGLENEVLMKQTYDENLEAQYAEYLFRFIDDERYITIEGRPLIMFYRPDHFPDARKSIERFRNVFIKKGYADPYLVAPQVFGTIDPRVFGMDAAAGFPPHNSGWNVPNFRKEVEIFDHKFRGHVADFDTVQQNALNNWSEEYRLFPGVCPSWDNEARKPNRGYTMVGGSPSKYGAWLEAASQQALQAPERERIVFINAWNEWAEGAYLEPDRHFGYAYLVETRKILEKVSLPLEHEQRDFGSDTSDRFSAPRRSFINLLVNLAIALLQKFGLKV